MPRRSALFPALALAAASMLAHDARAQSSRAPLVPADSLAPGRRVRITLAPRMRFLPAPQHEGIVQRVDGDSLAVRIGARDTTVARPDLRRLDVRLHTGRRGRNMLVAGVGGLLTGTVVGLGVGSMLGQCDEPGWDEFLCSEDPRDARIKLTAAYAGIGAGVGVVAGALMRTRRWERVAAPRRVSVAAGPGAVGFTLRF